MGAKVFWIGGPSQGRLGIVPRPRGAEGSTMTRAWREAGIDIVVSLLMPDDKRNRPVNRSSAPAGLNFAPFLSPTAVFELVRQWCAGRPHRRCAARGQEMPPWHRPIGDDAAAALISGGQNAETLKTIGDHGDRVTHAQRQWTDFSSWLADKRAGTTTAKAAPRFSIPERRCLD